MAGSVAVGSSSMKRSRLTVWKKRRLIFLRYGWDHWRCVFISEKESVNFMKERQNDVIYFTGESTAVVSSSPFVEEYGDRMKEGQMTFSTSRESAFAAVLRLSLRRLVAHSILGNLRAMSVEVFYKAGHAEKYVVQQVMEFDNKTENDHQGWVGHWRWIWRWHCWVYQQSQSEMACWTAIKFQAYVVCYFFRQSRRRDSVLCQCCGCKSSSILWPAILCSQPMMAPCDEETTADDGGFKYADKK